MGGLSLWHWLVVGAVVIILFGRVTFSALAADLAKGLREFRKEASRGFDDTQPP